MITTKPISDPKMLIIPTENMPLLKNGDILNSEEFERRCQAINDAEKAELIEGVVYMAAALRYRNHGKPHADIMGWLVTYQINTPGVEVGDNATVKLDDKNQPQPDALLRIKEGGNSVISDDDYIVGAPELIVEIAGSTVDIDTNQKFKLYRRHGVKEYLIWRVEEQQFDWYYLKSGKYRQQKPNAEGVIKSQVFPGLWLDIPALLSGNLKQVLAVLQQGLEMQEK